MWKKLPGGVGQHLAEHEPRWTVRSMASCLVSEIALPVGARYDQSSVLSIGEAASCILFSVLGCLLQERH